MEGKLKRENEIQYDNGHSEIWNHVIKCAMKCHDKKILV